MARVSYARLGLARVVVIKLCIYRKNVDADLCLKNKNKCFKTIVPLHIFTFGFDNQFLHIRVNIGSRIVPKGHDKKTAL